MSIGTLANLQREEEALAQIEKLIATLDDRQLVALREKLDIVAAHGSPKFRFLALPSEIRNQIYQEYFNFIDHVIKVKRDLALIDGYDATTIYTDSLNDCANILQTCRQLHYESRALYELKLSQRKWRFTMSIDRTFEALCSSRTSLFSPSALSQIKTIQVGYKPCISKLSGLAYHTGECRNIDLLCEPVEWSVDCIDEVSWSIQHRLCAQHSNTPIPINGNLIPFFLTWGMQNNSAISMYRNLRSVSTELWQYSASIRSLILLRLRGPFDLKTMLVTFHWHFDEVTSFVVADFGPLKDVTETNPASTDYVPVWDVYE